MKFTMRYLRVPPQGSWFMAPNHVLNTTVQDCMFMQLVVGVLRNVTSLGVLVEEQLVDPIGPAGQVAVSLAFIYSHVLSNV